MEPKTADRFGHADLSEEEILDGERLNELDVEDLIGHHVELDEQEDWRALEP